MTFSAAVSAFAESRFFRAYAYRTLVYLYGDVPYVDKIQDQFRIDFTRTPKEEVIAHMVEDLQFAVENLPTDPDAVKVGKLTKWAAEHLLSEVYLMQGDYAKAETAAENVINSGYFHLMEDRFVRASGIVHEGTVFTPSVVFRACFGIKSGRTYFETIGTCICVVRSQFTFQFLIQKVRATGSRQSY